LRRIRQESGDLLLHLPDGCPDLLRLLFVHPAQQPGNDQISVQLREQVGMPIEQPLHGGRHNLVGREPRQRLAAWQRAGRRHTMQRLWMLRGVQEQFDHRVGIQDDSGDQRLQRFGRQCRRLRGHPDLSSGRVGRERWQTQ
jgi:hypothetical protein